MLKKLVLNSLWLRLMIYFSGDAMRTRETKKSKRQKVYEKRGKILKEEICGFKKSKALITNHSFSDIFF